MNNLDVDVITDDKGRMVLRFNEDHSFDRGDKIMLNLTITIDSLAPGQYILHLSNNDIFKGKEYGG